MCEGFPHLPNIIEIKTTNNCVRDKSLLKTTTHTKADTSLRTTEASALCVFFLILKKTSHPDINSSSVTPMAASADTPAKALQVWLDFFIKVVNH